MYYARNNDDYERAKVIAKRPSSFMTEALGKASNRWEKKYGIIYRIFFVTFVIFYVF